MINITGLTNYSEFEIQNLISLHIQNLKENFHFEDLDFSIQNIKLFGSRIYGKASMKSDLDVKIQYIGTAREDDLFNALNEKNAKFYIDSIEVDFYTEKLKNNLPRRGNWATHKSDWRGNWAPEVVRNLVLRYSKENDVLLDPMIGGGTTAIEAKILNRHIVCSDVNDVAIERTKQSLDFTVENKSWQKVLKQDARELKHVEDESIDFILTHPPYVDIIKYSDGKIEEDISGIHDIDEFADEMEKVAKELYRVLKKGQYCAILIGDTRRNKMYQPLAYKVMQKFLDTGFLLKEDIIKRQFNCKATGFWVNKSKDFNFLLIMHEHLFVFKKV